MDEVIYFYVNLTIMAMATHSQQEIGLQRSLTEQRNDGRDGSERISWAVRPLMDQHRPLHMIPALLLPPAPVVRLSFRPRHYVEVTHALKHAINSMFLQVTSWRVF
jgi:hypothetical protein